jgi:hypothetical protein
MRSVAWTWRWRMKPCGRPRCAIIQSLTNCTSSTHQADIQGGLDPNKISGVGTNFELLVHVFQGPNKQRALKPRILLS